MLFADVAAASQAAAGTASKKARTQVLADCLRTAAADGPGGPEQAGLVALWLSGQTSQRRTGLGWASLRDLPPPAELATLTVTQVEEAFQRAAGATGAGSQAARRDALLRLLVAATSAEQRLLSGLVMGEVRHGAQVGLVLDAVAVAAAVPGATVRRALTLSGDLAATTAAALAGGSPALEAFGLRVGTPLSPMLASAAPDLTEALTRTGPAGIDWKLDGVRVQVHRDGTDVAVFTRTLDEVTDRLPEVVVAARALPVANAVLDGEVLAMDTAGRPLPFQVSSSRVARRDAAAAGDVPLRTWLFDALHVDGTDLLDEPGQARRAALEAVAPPELVVPRHVVEDPEDDEQAGAAQAFAASALAAGHEGVVVKGLQVPYAMGRRGSGWVKVKPRITLDLVVLAAEWGHGRRTGWLSNLHLGARDPDGEYGPPGAFVMLGKTFKGLTDAMLTWQTEHLQAIATRTLRHGVEVRPELVVEIAFDGVQTSPRYPAGMALRFARVLAHRPDKPASQADTIGTVRAHHGASGDADGAPGVTMP